MANIKISELNPLVTIQDADVLPIVDNAITKKVTAAILRSYTEGNSVLLTGAQTVAGIKTFTSQLASSVATGTAPFSVASTTKVTNLNADLLDGLSSADFALSTRTLTAGTGLTGGGDLTANRTFAIDSTVATLTGTQTLTNKTLTSPVINEILDSNGNEILGFTPIASATDYITIKNGIGVGVPLHISAAGSSTNTGLHLEPKGTGLVQISDGTDATKGIRFRSSASATGAITLIDAVSSAGRVITLPNATGTLALTSDLTAYVPTTRTVSTTSPLAGGGALSGDLTLSIPQASGSVNGYLASTDFATFNAKQNAITLTTTGTSGAATLVGSTLNIPNYADTDTGITSLNGLTALTQTFAVGSSGTDFAISSATSTHTFNLPTASAANRGALSSADWTTFNNKQNALTNPITGTGTTNYLPKFTGASALGNSIISESGSAISIAGNLGVSATISSWISQYKAIDIGLVGFLYSRSDNDETSVGTNWYRDGSAAFLYKNNGFASMYTQGSGQHTWYNAPSGTAGNAVTFTQAMTLDASGNLGIGTTTPAYKLDVNGTGRFNGGLVVENNSIVQDGTRPIITLKQSGTSKLLLGISSVADDIIVGDVSGDVDFRTNSQAFNFSVNNGGSIAFKLASNAAATFSAGVTVGTGLSLSNATAPASGIEFPATQVASASANNLDDYEEGTWTMGIAFNGASVGVTYNVNTGTYTKIGRQVTVNGYVSLTNKGTSLGDASITGLPFTIGNANSNYSSPSLTFSGITFVNQFQGEGAVGQTIVRLQEITSLGALSTITDADFANNSYILISFTYFV